MLPLTQRLALDEQEGLEFMEFRLVYKGRLPAETSSPRVKDKHRIRKVFHAQLRELWVKHPSLLWQTEDLLVQKRGADLDGERTMARALPGAADAKPWVEWLADNYARCGFRFVPLLRKQNKFVCSLSILFLRRGHPGDILASGGDIDNRIKVLLDSLKVPGSCDEIPSSNGIRPLPDPGENPFYCLLEDDALITSLTITTDRLLTPIENGESANDVELIVHVAVIDPRALLGPTRLV